MNNKFYSITIIILTLSSAFSATSQARLDLEAGLVFTGYNDVRIPGAGGTLFSFKDDLEAKPAFFYRLRADYTIKSRHTFSLLFAPFETTSTGGVDRDILFEGVLFPANTSLEGSYKFNSYRLTYRYDIVRNDRLEFGLGFTAKIRDARIALSSTSQQSEKTNVGFVPIINFRLMWHFSEDWGLLLYGDALGAPQGRAEDILIAATYRFSEHFGIRAGYRILEGGTDNAEVYNFSLFNYASFGATYSF